MAKRTMRKTIKRALSADNLHKIPALVSGIFLVLMSLSGIGMGVKAFYYETVYYDTMLPAHKDYQPVGVLLDQIATQTDAIIGIYGETKTLWVADVIRDGERVSWVFHPVTGQLLAPLERAEIFDFLRTLHTRLLLDDTGRAFTFFASLCMVIVCLAGVKKLARKKGGIRKIFRPTPSDTVAKKWHTTLGIFVGIPLFILGFTGAYTAIQSVFKIQYETVIAGDGFESNPQNAPLQRPYNQMPPLQTLDLRDVKTITLPAIDDEFDVMTITTATQMIYLDRYTGDILSTETYSPLGRVDSLMSTIHQTNDFWLWLFIWMVSALCVPVFLGTGILFIMGKKRPKRKPK